MFLIEALSSFSRDLLLSILEFGTGFIWPVNILTLPPGPDANVIDFSQLGLVIDDLSILSALQVRAQS